MTVAMWRLSGLTVNYKAWKNCLQEYKARIVSVRSDYFFKMIGDNQINPRQLFNSINKLLNCNSFSQVTASTHLCNKFFFSFLIPRLIMNARVFVLLLHCCLLLLMLLILVLLFPTSAHLIHTLFKRRFLK